MARERKQISIRKPIRINQPNMGLFDNLKEQYLSKKYPTNMALKITKGIFRVERGTEKSKGSIQTSLISSSNSHPICFSASEHPQVITDFEFIAEAFNVANETGLSPRELLGERNSLIAELQLSLPLIEHAINATPTGRLREMLCDLNLKFREVIDKNTASASTT